MQLICLRPSQLEPVSVGEAKRFLRIDLDVEDELLASLIAIARDAIEDYTQRSLLSKVWRLTTTMVEASKCQNLSANPCSGKWAVDLPRAPFIRLAAEPKVVYQQSGISYLPAYQLTPHFDRGQLLFSGADLENQSLQIDFVAGYGDDPGSIPPVLRHALLLLVAEFYQNRQIERQGFGQGSIGKMLQPYVWMGLR